MMEDGSDPPTSLPDIVAIVVTHNSASLLDGHLEALRPCLVGVRHRIVVVDSGSTDESVAVARRAEPPVTVISLPGNLGYAAGINAAISAVPARAWLVLNPDTMPQSGSVAKLLSALSEDRIGITVPMLTDETGHIQHSLRRRPTLLRVLGEAVLGGPRAGRWAALSEVVHDPASYGRPGTYEWATGAAMCLSAECVQAVGAWDESFFLYSEETDFCLRAADAGLRVRYVPDAVVTHLGGESNVSPALFALLSVNRVRLYRRRSGAVRAAFFRLGLVVGSAVRSPIRATHRAAFKALLGDLDAAKAVARDGGPPGLHALDR
jgi:N-acetylglucosaminyl-diphospho-decaprenol L-rhamnosyltransferase